MMDELLNLKGQGLSEFPDKLLQQKQITNLNLENNQISIIPEWIQELTNLKVLYLSGNAIDDIHHLTALPGLEVLHLNDNRISRIPDEVTNWARLKRLFINGNLLDKLPASLGKLQELKILLAAENTIGHISEDFFSLPNLETLNLFHNRLTLISENLCRVKKLNYLQLSMNQIERLPESIGQNVNIKTLSSFSNKLSRIPSQLVKLSGLENLNFGNNNIARIEHVPDSIRQLSIYANPVEFIDRRLLDSFLNSSRGNHDYIYVDSQQADALHLKKSDLGNRLKVIDIPSGKIHWSNYKNMPQELIKKWGLERSKDENTIR
jgi:Leucine-rich repeat (LRR) protein